MLERAACGDVFRPVPWNRNADTRQFRFGSRDEFPGRSLRFVLFACLCETRHLSFVFDRVCTSIRPGSA